MKAILLPTDFSPASTNALHYAAALAQDLQTSLVILHVFQVPVSMTEVPVAALSIDDMKRNTEEQLTELKNAVLHLFPNIPKVYTEARMGNTTDEIITLSAQLQPEALVMSSHGHTELEHFLMGSSTLTIIRNIEFPVFIIPPGIHYKKIERIGLACDMKEVADTFPLEKISTLLHTLKGKLFVLNVNKQDSVTNPQAVLENAYLESMLTTIPHEYHFLNKPHITEAINEFAELNNLDLMIMIPKKQQWFDLLIHESTSANLLKQAHIPLLSIKTNPVS